VFGGLVSRKARKGEKATKELNHKQKATKEKCLLHFFDTKSQRNKGTKFFCKTNMLIIGKCLQPFELIELIEPLEHYNSIKPA